MKKPYNPAFIPIKINDKDTIEILKLETEARARLQKFDSLMEKSIIRKEVLMLFSMKESLESTRIEGTQTTFNELFESKSSGHRNTDVEEVFSYLEGLNQAMHLLQSLPISTRMFLQIHETILKNGRGAHRNPGKYRTTQNFIGPTDNIKDASYIPPTPNLINEYMSNLENYINDQYEDDLGVLAKTAVIHAQFETIHPFLDGNGKVGRILIIIYLLDKKIISFPSFFVSEELEKNKNKYYALLNNLRKDEPEWKEWILFFLNSSINQADKYIEKLTKIENLYSEICSIDKLNEKAVLFIFTHPIFTISKMRDELNISYGTAKRYVDILLDNNIVYKDDKLRNTQHFFYDLIDLL